MAEWTITIHGGDKVAATLQRLGAQGPQTLSVGLVQWAEMVMADSKANYVPVDTGVLRGTGHVKPPVVDGTGATVTLGYGGAAAPYALAVHENPRAGKTGGVSPSGRRYRHWARHGEWKYLETPVKKHLRRLRVYLARALTQAVREARRVAGR